MNPISPNIQTHQFQAQISLVFPKSDFFPSKFQERDRLIQARHHYETNHCNKKSEDIFSSKYKWQKEDTRRHAKD